MGGMAEVYAEIHRDDVSRMKQMEVYLREQCLAANLPVHDYTSRRIAELIYYHLITPYGHNQFTPLETIMTTVKTHINVVDAYIFIHLQEIQYNLRLANTWSGKESPCLDEDERTFSDKLDYRKKLLSMLEVRSSISLQDKKLPARELMLRQLEESHDAFMDPNTQRILKDNVNLGRLNTFKQVFQALFSSLTLSWTNVFVKDGYHNLHKTINDARIDIVMDAFNHDNVYESMMRHKRR